MHGFSDNYRSADPYPWQSRALLKALDDAGDLRSQVPALKAFIAVLEALSRQVKTATAEDVLGEAIGCLEDAMAALEVGADKAVNDCDD